jgi:hypothetical protein
MTTFDNNGNVLRGTRFRKQATRVKTRVQPAKEKPMYQHRRTKTNRAPGLGAFFDTSYDASSVGALAWEWLHPEQVQEEYVAAGQTPPTVEEIRSNAESGITSRVTENVSTVAQSTLGTGQWLLVLAGLYLVVRLLDNMPKAKA